ncbi:MAG TPA: phage major capsid protein, partial [Brevundimonas sp.]|nr:phage major capsid protein [Brevundimonas sp.]
MTPRHSLAVSALACVGSRAMFAQPANAPLMLRGLQIAYAAEDDRGSGDLKEIRQHLDRVTGEVKQTAEKALKQAEDTGKVTDEVKASADKLLVEQKSLQGKLEALEERQQQIEQNAAGRREQQEQPKSLGQAVSESEALKAFVANGARGTCKIEVNNVITSGGASGGGLITPQRDAEIVRLRRRTPRIRSLLNQGRTGSNMVQYARQTERTNNAAVVAENTLKAESNYAWAEADAPVRTIAHWVPISRNTLDDAATLQTEIDGELRYGLDIAEDEELLNGDGTGQHLSGLWTNASAYAAPFAIDNETPIDTLRLALLQLELEDYAGDGFVLNPMEWARIELTKDQAGSYIFANVLQLAGPVLWGRPVVSTTAMDAGEFLAGEFAVAATIYDRMDAEVLFSTEDRDNFVKNMVTARAEKRLALAVKRGAAMVAGAFPLAA